MSAAARGVGGYVGGFRDFHIDWRMKALAFQLFDRVPFGHEAYYRLQRHVTRTVPRQLSPTSDTAKWFLEHERVLSRHAGPGGLGSLAIFEFGAGWDLYGNCVAWCLGAERQVLYRPDPLGPSGADQRVARPSPQGAAAGCDPATRGHDAHLRPVRGPVERGLRDRIQCAGRCRRDPPARRCTLTAGVTTSVLEHIPPAQIARILRECHRLLPPGAVMSHVIDYSDHYAHSDSHITPYHYLTFDEREWQRFNPGNPLPEPLAPRRLPPPVRRTPDSGSFPTIASSRTTRTTLLSTLKMSATVRRADERRPSAAGWAVCDPA